MAGLRVVIAEDEPSDAELIVRELIKSGYEPVWRRVDSREELERALADAPLDLVISDHAMPQFTSADALDCVRRTGKPIPFIVVSQTIGEEEAVRLMREGAADFLMKDRLGRLGEAVRRALDQRRLQIERDAARQETEQRSHQLVASHRRLQALASELTLAEQRERKKLAGELHDYLAQMLSLGRMKAAQLRPKVASTPGAAEPLREIDELLKNALEYTRTLMAKLSPPVLEELGLPAALQWLAEQMPPQGLTVEIRSALEKVPLPDDRAVLLFQSVRELLINVVKHAGTCRATVDLRLDEAGRLQVAVQDAGCGFDMAAVETTAAGEHFGLFSVRQRMDDMGGWLTVTSAVGQGTTVTLTLPLEG